MTTRLHTVAGAATGIAIAVAVLWSCSVDRKSDGLACTSSATCASGRVCNQGYCIVGSFRDAGPDTPVDAAVCPNACPDCDFGTKTCNITGAGGGTITCPSGWNCTIGCASANACGDVDCTQSLSCKLTCGAANACDNVRCTAGKCTVTCDGNGTTRACNNITCTQGHCDVHCDGSDSCGNVTFGAAGGSATCSGDMACLDVTCGGGPCTVACGSGSAACGTILTGAGSAAVTCSGASACGDITSGTGPLDAKCLLGSSACGSITCTSSCKCDVACSPAANCGTNRCPSGGGQLCETLGVCDSTVKPQCSHCP